MMSDFPGEITKQILLAPPEIIRSIMYSLAARGRLVSPSRRLPTGRSSFEKANGWIRLPAPAAGIIPHIVFNWSVSAFLHFRCFVYLNLNPYEHAGFARPAGYFPSQKRGYPLYVVSEF